MDKKLYYTIGEVAEMIGEQPTVLRFWETEFKQIRPVKNKRGVRSYTEHDIEILRRIRHLTRDCGYTLEGAREQMRTRPVEDPKMELVNNLKEVRSFLAELKEVL
ncbi:MAG: MerR family transcriptional regulator [Bacteroidales bacterium]|nr:MerR family transcriptional regulator [Bacteroidales bacterium]